MCFHYFTRQCLLHYNEANNQTIVRFVSLYNFWPESLYTYFYLLHEYAIFLDERFEDAEFYCACIFIVFYIAAILPFARQLFLRKCTHRQFVEPSLLFVLFILSNRKPFILNLLPTLTQYCVSSSISESLLSWFIGAVVLLIISSLS